MNATSPSPAAPASGSVSAKEIDASARVPLFVLFVGAAVWLLAGSAFGLIASIKLHGPNFLSNCAWLTYGRVHAVATNALLYGFAVPAGLGVGLWIIARMGQTKVAHPWAIAIGGKLWNLGVLVGCIGIFLGDSTGFENLEMPRYAAVILFLSYLLIGTCAALTLHSRGEPALEPPQWFLLAALFWFPWIFSTAHLLLTFCPVRGVTQAVVDWWFSANLTLVWLGLVGLGVLLYFLPRLVNRPLHSRHLALFTFWTLILFASWSGIPSGAPVPAWIPTLSTVATVLTAVTVLAAGANVWNTVRRGSPSEDPPPGKFMAFGMIAFALSWLMNAASAVPKVGAITNFTWFTVADSYLNVYGFFAMTMIGAIYYIVPKVTGMDWPSAKAVRAHYQLAAVGVVLFVLPLAIGGVRQGIQLKAMEDFTAVTKSGMPFVGTSTIGELLILAGHFLLVVNLVRLSVGYYRKHFAPLYAEATAELKPAEVKP